MSKAYEEFVEARCEEITQSNTDYISLSNERLQTLKNLKKVLTKDSFQNLQKLEEATSKMQILCETLCYNQGTKDFKELF